MFVIYHYIIIPLCILCSVASYAGDKSLLATILDSQFPFSHLNTRQAQRDFSDKVIEGILTDEVIKDSNRLQQLPLAAAVSAQLHNEKQIFSNTRAKGCFLVGMPLLCLSRTRGVGIGWIMAGSTLQIDAACRLPHLDPEYMSHTLVGISIIVEELKSEKKSPIRRFDAPDEQV